MNVSHAVTSEGPATVTNETSTKEIDEFNKIQYNHEVASS